MGIDITIRYKDGRPANDIFTNESYTHIACAIDFVRGEGSLSVGMRHECYDLIEQITCHSLTIKYEGDDNVWTTEDIACMIDSLEYNVQNNYINENDDVRNIRKFLRFLVEHKLNIYVS